MTWKVSFTLVSIWKNCTVYSEKKKHTRFVIYITTLTRLDITLVSTLTVSMLTSVTAWQLSRLTNDDVTQARNMCQLWTIWQCLNKFAYDSVWWDYGCPQDQFWKFCLNFFGHFLWKFWKILILNYDAISFFENIIILKYQHFKL